MSTTTKTNDTIKIHLISEHILRIVENTNPQDLTVHLYPQDKKIVIESKTRGNMLTIAVPKFPGGHHASTFSTEGLDVIIYN